MELDESYDGVDIFLKKYIQYCRVGSQLIFVF